MKKHKKKRKLRVDRLLIFFLLCFCFGFIIYKVLTIRITNIYISGNSYLSDQQIIELANIGDYPSVLSSYKKVNSIKDNVYIKDVKMKTKFTKVYIEVEENRPLFYSEYMKKTVLLDGTTVSDKYAVPTVLNYVVDDVYQEFVKQIGLINVDCLNRISEIEYKPNNVDSHRFLLTMTDGNLVYINNQRFYNLDKYLDIVKNFPNQNGILYLDYGNNFEIFK